MNHITDQELEMIHEMDRKYLNYRDISEEIGRSSTAVRVVLDIWKWMNAGNWAEIRKLYSSGKVGANTLIWSSKKMNIDLPEQIKHMMQEKENAKRVRAASARKAKKEKTEEKVNPTEIGKQEEVKVNDSVKVDTMILKMDEVIANINWIIGQVNGTQAIMNEIKDLIKGQNIILGAMQNNIAFTAKNTRELAEAWRLDDE